MRYEKGRKDASRRRIMTVAAERFRRDGIVGSGLAGIMRDAGLTNGAFYPHFSSKAALVRETLAATLEDQADDLGKTATKAGLEGLIESYLSARHRDNLAKGCAAAALLPDLARQPLATRRLCAERIAAALREIAAALPPTVPDPEAVALGVYATLIGSLEVARAVKGTPLSERALRAGVEAARTIGRTTAR